MKHHVMHGCNGYDTKHESRQEAMHEAQRAQSMATSDDHGEVAKTRKTHTNGDTHGGRAVGVGLEDGAIPL